MGSVVTGITVGHAPTDLASLDALELAAARDLLPSFDAQAARALLRDSFTEAAPYRGAGIGEGRAFRLEVGLGTVAVRTFDPARAERDSAGCPPPAVPADSLAARFDSYALAQDHYWIGDVATGYGRWLDGQAEAEAIRGRVPSRRSRVSSWSAKSRARMLRAYAELDYRAVNAQPGIPAMVTLTYPGDWLPVAPSFDVVKAHLRALLDRFQSEYGYRPAGLWKMEFQRRGAPHFHLFLSVPVGSRDGRSFERWLSDTWVSVVGHPDPEQRRLHAMRGTHVSFGAASRCTDGRRLAIYFLKHGTKTRDGKEYQNEPPEAWGIQADPVTGEVTSEGGTGRFWGYWGMSRELASVDLSPADWYKVRRILRRWRTAQGQKVRALGSGGGNSGGWALVNDGPAFAALLSRALAAV